MTAVRRWRAIGTDCEVLADTAANADAAAAIARRQLAELDLACSRFRDDSELRRLRTGTAVPVGPVLNGALSAALRAARVTEGLVDPSVGTLLRRIGYDDDFDRLPADRPGTGDPRPAPGHWRILHDEATRRVVVPHGVELDLGATAKAWAVDRCAATVAHELSGRFLINFGGDIAVSGASPITGWSIGLDDHDDTPEEERPVVTITSGAIASSSTVRRSWKVGGESRHHIVDPRTGMSADPVWRTVTVTARTCETANTAATAAIVLGTEAPRWLAHRRLHARLLSRTGAIVYVGQWPADSPYRQARTA